jgi:hypothetical protein
MITKIFLTVLSLVVAWILFSELLVTYSPPTEEEKAFVMIMFNPVGSTLSLIIVGFFIGLLLNLSNRQKS